MGEELKIKNPTVLKQIEEKTAEDPQMRKFLETIITAGYRTSHYMTLYKKEIDKALGLKED